MQISTTPKIRKKDKTCTQMRWFGKQDVLYRVVQIISAI